MSIIGDLFIKLGLDSSDFNKGIDKSVENMTNATKKMADSFSTGMDKAGNEATNALSGSIKKAQDQMNQLVVTAKRSADNIASALKGAIPPGGIIPPKMNTSSFFINSGALIKSITQITDYIIALKQMGMISDEVAIKLNAFSRMLYFSGYGVDQIREYIQELLIVLSNFSTTCNTAENSVKRLTGGVLGLANGMRLLRGATGNGGMGGVGEDMASGMRKSIPLLTAGAEETKKYGKASNNAANSSRRSWGEFFDSFRSGANRFTSDVDNMGNAAGNASGKMSKGFKDVARIVQGIMISQLFYQMVGNIKRGAAAMAEFTMSVEDARVSFGLLMKDQAKADRFMNTLQDFAARTPYNFQQSADNARKLLAYGFSPSNMEPIMNTLADASAAAGDPEAFNRIGRALGQIHTKGRLASQEVLQLTEAGIPAFQILQEKLHLTADQLENIGKLKIPADVAINAILKGMQERYGGAADAMSNTVRGMLSTIKDNALIIGNEAFGPFFQSFKRALTKIRDASDKLREMFRNGGLGGVLRQIFSPEVFAQLQLFAANIRILRENFSLLLRACWPLVQVIGQFLLTALNAVLPFISAITRVLTVLFYLFTSNSQAVRIFVGAVGGLIVAALVTKLILNLGAAIRSLFIVKMITKLIMGLAGAIRFMGAVLVSNPWVALIGVAAGALMYFGLTSKKVQGWLTGLGGKITKTFGADPSKEFAPKMKDNTKTAGEFNQNLKISKDSIDKMGDAAKKAGKKAKDMLMSFDEVFNLKDKDENKDDLDPNFGNLDGIEDIGSPSIPPVQIPEPEFPEIDNPIQGWVDKFKDTLGTKFKNALIGAGLGALIGAAIGGIIGGPAGALLGAKIGAVCGAIAGMFWDNLSQEMKQGVIGAGIGGVIGAVIGGLIGGPAGAAIGAGIGTLVGGIVGYFWEDLAKYFDQSTTIGAAVGGGIGATVGFAFGGPMGAAIGGVLGTVIGSLVGHFWEDIKTFFTSDTGIGATAGTVVGGALGFIFGGPLGAALGAGLGGVVGGIAGHFWEDMKTWFTSDTGQGTVIGAGVGMILAGPIGAVVGGILGANRTEINAWITETRTNLSNWWADTKTNFNEWSADTGVTLTNWWNSTSTGFNTWITDTKNTFNGWWTDTKTGFSTWWSDTTTGLGGWWADTKNGFNTWWSDTKSGFSTWWGDTDTGFGKWWGDTGSGLSTWVSDTLGTFGNWRNLSWTDISNWWSNTRDGFGRWWADTRNGVSTWASDTGSRFGTWVSDSSGKFGSWVSDTTSRFSGWWSNTSSRFSSWRSNTSSTISGWWSSTSGNISSWYSNTMSTFGNWWGRTQSRFSSWWSESKTGFSTWCSGIYNNVTGWFGRLGDKMHNLFEKMKFWKSESEKDYRDTSQSYEERGRSGPRLAGHARGGVFNKEHIARFAEGNKAEAIIPLQNAGAMAPFVDAVASGVSSALGSMIAAGGNATPTTTGTQDERPILYVGTLIADDRSLRELERKMEVVRLKDANRRG